MALLLPTGLCNVTVNAAAAAESGGYTYEVHGEKATITGCTWTNASYLEIPRTIDGYPVVAIGANAFQKRNDLLGLIVSEGIEVIDYRAFWYCQNLSWVVLPDSLTTIEEEAFSGCSNLQSVDFGDGLKTIGYAAFAHCGELYDLRLPEGLETIGMSAFYKCYSLESVWLPDSLKTLGARAFDSCVKLYEIYIPGTVTSIGADVLYYTPIYYNYNYWYGDAFYIGAHLLEVKTSASGSYTVLPGTVLIAGGAFENCNNLTEVMLPDSLQSIGKRAFYSCDKLTAITIPAKVTAIEDEAFYWCEALTDVRFQGTVANIGQNAFAQTPYYSNGENWENGAFYVGDCLVKCENSVSGTLQVRPGTKTIGSGAMKGLSKLTEVILPDSVTTIEAEAFYQCTGLKSIQLGKSVSQIGSGAFAQCSALESITVDNGNTTYRSQNNCLIKGNTLVVGCKTSQIPLDGSVTVIGEFAFEGCFGLVEVTIPDTIQTIGDGAFRDCNALVAVNLGNGVQVIGKRAFEECDVLSQIDFGKSVHTIEDYGFAFNHQIKHLAFPASLRHIGEEAFSNSTGLVSLEFQNGLQTIGKNCFVFSEKLTSVRLPDSLEEIKEGAFYACEKLSNLVLGEGLVTIGDSAFSGCEALVSLVIPDKVQSIGKSAFADCISLRQVNLGRVKKIGTWAFSVCRNLTQIYIPDTVTEIGRAAFAYCPAMKQMTVSTENLYYHSQGNCIINTSGKYIVSGCKNSIIPDDGSVTILDAYSFAGCSTLKSIVVPDQVVKIYLYTFLDCSGLEYMQLPFVGGHVSSDSCFGFIFGADVGSLNDIYVPASLKRVVITGGTTVGSSAFYKCAGLQEVVLSESITYIDYQAFKNCSQLQRVVIPGNLENMKYTDIFSGSPNLMLHISAGQEGTINYVKENNLPHQIGGLITFRDDQGRLIEKKWYSINATISTPAVPEKPADDRYIYEISWTPNPGNCIGNQTISLRYIACSINGNVLGELNGDSKINSLDGLLLMRYLNGWNVDVTFPESMDVNGDGKINSLDGLILMRHLNGWNVSIG